MRRRAVFVVRRSERGAAALPGLFFFRRRMAAPLQPFHLFGKRKPVSRSLLERLSDVWIDCLGCALLRLDSATAILFSPQVHLTAAF